MPSPSLINSGDIDAQPLPTTKDLPDAAKAAALEAQDHVVTEARQDLERAREEAEGEASPGYVEPWEIAQAPAERLPEILSGVRVLVEPGRGRVAERVRLARED